MRQVYTCEKDPFWLLWLWFRAHDGVTLSPDPAVEALKLYTIFAKCCLNNFVVKV